MLLFITGIMFLAPAIATSKNNQQASQFAPKVPKEGLLQVTIRGLTACIFLINDSEAGKMCYLDKYKIRFWKVDFKMTRQTI
jgi:hypothetical protein